MNNYEHASRLTELTDLGAHELAKRLIELEKNNDIECIACDEAATRHESIRELLNAALEREASLAAHVEATTDALTLAKDRIELITGIAVERGASVYAAIDIWPGEMQRVIDQSPTTTLARRDLVKQAEALEDCANALDQCGYGAAAQGTRVRADKYRQRAQEVGK